MNIITCSFKDNIAVDNKEYYRLINTKNNEEHLIPASQIEIFKELDFTSEYSFIAEYNYRTSKTFLSIIHPSYPINSVITLPITGIECFEEKKQFLLKSDYYKPLKVICFNNQENFKTVSCKVIGYKRGIPILRNVDTRNSRWKLDEIYSFKINSITQIIDKKNVSHTGLDIKIDESNNLKIKVQGWQKPPHWKANDIKCKVIGINKDGLPKLISYDSRHPYHTIGKKSTFYVKDFFTKKNRFGNEISLIEVEDENQLSYEVFAVPNQDIKLNIGDPITCLVEDFSFKVKLKQVDFEDPFFYEFEEIDQDPEFYQKYFKPYLNKDTSTSTQLQEQYNQHSGFWVFTFCNKVLPEIKRTLIETQNLKELQQLISKQLLFEQWIIKKGILRAINNLDDRKSIKLKVQTIIERCSIELEVLNIINTNRLETYLQSDPSKVSALHIQYIIQYATIFRLNACDILNLLERTSDEHSFILRRIQFYIKRQKVRFKTQEFGDYFIPSNELNIKQKQNFQNFLDWTYVELFIYTLLNDKKKANLQRAIIYRYYAQIANDSLESKTLLINAFYILSNIEESYHENTLNYKNNLTVNTKHLRKNIFNSKPIKLNPHYQSVKVIERHYKGFKVQFGEFSGYLPLHNITDKNLKSYQLPEINWETNAELLLISREFNFAIVKQLDPDSTHYSSKNLSKVTSVKKGTIVSGVVKRIESYGIFISTIYGDGLLHNSQISFEYIDSADITSIFSLKEKIFIKVLEVRPKIEFTFKGLYGTDYSDYYTSKIQLLDDDSFQDRSFDDFQYKIEYEKGVIFEFFAIFQNQKNEKIKYLKIAKAFYSNTQNARSYLLNIYVEYFESLIKLDNLIKDYSFDNYKVFKQNILGIKDKIQSQTIENFPESKNLLFFIDILYLFNSQDENDLIKLFNLIKNPFEKNDYKLKTVAKNALANNLIISDLSENSGTNLDAFTHKNLRRIHKFLNHGVHSIEESIEDIHAKELKQKIKYTQGLINQDEGEKLEFKATFKTPIPNKEKDTIIKNLKQKIQNTTSQKKRNQLELSIKKITEQAQSINEIDKILIHSSLKTICAFANSNGGTLLIGVKDDQEIFGLEQDYHSFKKDEQNRDGFGKFFDSKVSDYLGNSFSSTYLEKEFIKFPKGDILVVKVKPSLEEIFLLKNELGKSDECIYVRNLSSSEKLKGKELARFIKSKFEQRLKLGASGV